MTGFITGTDLDGLLKKLEQDVKNVTVAIQMKTS